MAKIREGHKSALLVVDAQVGVLRNLWDAPRIITNIHAAVAKARNQAVPEILSVNSIW